MCISTFEFRLPLLLAMKSQNLFTEELTASGKSVVAANAAAIFKKKKPTCEPLKISYLSLTVATKHHFLSTQIEMEKEVG